MPVTHKNLSESIFKLLTKRFYKNGTYTLKRKNKELYAYTIYVDGKPIYEKELKLSHMHASITELFDVIFIISKDLEDKRETVKDLEDE